MERLCEIWNQTAHLSALVRLTILPRHIKPFFLGSGNSGSDIGTWHHVDEWANFVRRLKIDKTIKDPFSPYLFVFYAHVPATINPHTAPRLNLY